MGGGHVPTPFTPLLWGLILLLANLPPLTSPRREWRRLQILFWKKRGGCPHMPGTPNRGGSPSRDLTATSRLVP